MAVAGDSARPVAAAHAEAAAAHFASRLTYETDVSDVHRDLAAVRSEFVVVDSRSEAAWDHGHIPGALHLPTQDIATRAPVEIPGDATVVTYCWGPGCNGATKAALAFARLGYVVQEMIGGYEYWVREGLPTEDASGISRSAPDPLTVPAPRLTCAC